MKWLTSLFLGLFAAASPALATTGSDFESITHVGVPPTARTALPPAVTMIFERPCAKYPTLSLSFSGCFCGGCIVI